MGNLGKLAEWAGNISDYFTKRNAQSYLLRPAFAMVAGGSACGAGDKEEKKETPAPACGAGDKEEKKEEAPASACGAGDKEEKRKKGSSCFCLRRG